MEPIGQGGWIRRQARGELSGLGGDGLEECKGCQQGM